MKSAFTRRRVLLTGAIAGAAVALGRAAHAEQPKLSPDDPQAQALGYVEDATAVDTSKWPRKAEGQNCANCALYQDQDGGDWGGCGIFPGKLVAANGWCNAWAPKA
jgi:hypothetical protein